MSEDEQAQTGAVEIWSWAGASGGSVYLGVYGSMVVLHSTDDAQRLHLDELFDQRADGRPVELTRSSVRGIAQHILDNVPAEEPPIDGRVQPKRWHVPVIPDQS